MKGFAKNNPVGQMYERAVYENRYRTARMNILLVVIFTAINIVLLFAEAETYFLFSASVPYWLSAYGLLFMGKIPVADGFEVIAVDNAVSYALLAAAVVIIAVYLLCWIFAKKKVGWMITALVLVSIDTVVMFAMSGVSADNVFDILFHAWIIVELAMGISAHYKLKKMPVTVVTAEGYENINEVVVEPVAPQNQYAGNIQHEVPVTPAYVENKPVENTLEINDDANFI